MYYNEIKFEREMIKMNTLTIIIFIFFLALGYVLVTYRKNRASVEYDERQASIRNHGYKHAFSAIAISDSFLLLLVEELKLKITPTFLLMAPLFIGCIAFASYTIFKGAYIAMHENLLGSSIIFIALGIVDLICSILGLIENAAKWDGNVLMLLFDLFMLLVGGNYAYQLYISKVKK